MELFALIGPSGTGKSHRAMFVAKKYRIECIIDDGILISNCKILAGSSAKKEKTKMASVKHAIFYNEDYAREMRIALANYKPNSLLILGTSERMVRQIADRLALPEITKIINIEDIATEQEIKLALEMRNKQGKHVIPVPTFELQQDFSGYFLHSLKILQKKKTGEITSVDKTIIRPTYSYFGDFNISDNAISQIVSYETKKIDGVAKLNFVKTEKHTQGIGIDISININYGINMSKLCKKIKHTVAYHIEEYTSINVQYINIFIKSVILS